jgi:hypothetical protein
MAVVLGTALSRQASHPHAQLSKTGISMEAESDFPAILV